jgi:single-stranded DNA-binding protein
VIPSQIYLSGRLAAAPEIGTTRAGKSLVRILLETSLVRETRPGELQSELVVLPMSCFAREAEVARNLVRGDPITVGAHLYGTRFETPSGEVKHGVQLTVDTILSAGGMLRHPQKELVR